MLTIIALACFFGFLYVVDVWLPSLIAQDKVSEGTHEWVYSHNQVRPHLERVEHIDPEIARTNQHILNHESNRR